MFVFSIWWLITGMAAQRTVQTESVDGTLTIPKLTHMFTSRIRWIFRWIETITNRPTATHWISVGVVDMKPSPAQMNEMKIRKICLKIKSQNQLHSVSLPSALPSSHPMSLLRNSSPYIVTLNIICHHKIFLPFPLRNEMKIRMCYVERMSKTKSNINWSFSICSHTPSTADDTKCTREWKKIIFKFIIMIYLTRNHLVCWIIH